MKKKVLFLVLLFVVTSAILFGHDRGGWGGNRNGWGHGYGDRDGWGHSYGNNWGNGNNNGTNMTPTTQEQFLNANPGIRIFIDQKKASGATILHVSLERDFANEIMGEVVVVESNAITVYYINTQTGEVISQYAGNQGTGW